MLATRRHGLFVPNSPDYVLMSEAGEVSIEIAHHLSEAARVGGREPSRKTEILEFLEAIVVAIVAVATAWSGYQAARWDGQQMFLYGRSSKLRIEAQGTELRGNQVQIYDSLTVDEWLKAEAAGETNLAGLFERRLSAEFRPAFEAWKQTDPLHDLKAPDSPMSMKEYHKAAADESVTLNRQATDMFEQGAQARDRADQYVRVTVSLATVLLLAALSQRFRTTTIRAALIALAFLGLFAPMWRVLTLPRL